MKGRPSTSGHPASVVFDFDYTLADSTVGVVECMNYALAAMGLPVASPDEIQALIGVALPETFRSLSGESDEGLTREFIRLFTQRGDEVMLDGIRLFAPVRSVVAELTAAGMTLGILSNKYRYRIEDVLRREQLEHAFAAIVGSEDVSAGKPDPAGLQLLLARLGSSVSDAVYVGDSVIDAETSRRAGMPFVAVLSGVTPREAFASYRPAAILDDLAGLPAVLMAGLAGGEQAS
jgi:phosphoglycolate phosphatase